MAQELFIHEQKSLNWLTSKYPHPLEQEKILKSYEFAAEAHKTQFRKSGVPYITHCLAVACILTDMGMDSASVCAGLLHDVVEDTEITVEEISQRFGPDIALMVDGVTKLSKLECRSKAERQVESFRKMFLAMAKDIRVILIKLADRLHNMRTLDVHTPSKQIEIAKETLEIYAPLAHRLGIFSLKNELEDLSLRYLEPEKYFYIVDALSNLRLEREEYIDEVIGLMYDKLGQENIEADIKGRPKHCYSIYRKMVGQDKEISEIYDLIAVRIIVKTIQDCYAALIWAYENHAELGIDPDRLAVSGLSAGGGLAAGVALMARDLKGPALCLQMPLYAELDYRLDSPSSQEITDPKVWCRDNCEKSWAKVLSPGHMPTAYESPALAKDLTGLPPLFSYIGQLDPGRDENIRYWSRMMGAGVDVEYHVFPGCYHCFELSVPDAEPSKAAYEMMYAALRRAFGLE